MAYTKLHESLVTSTIWREPHHVRIAWITILALADKNGEVMASIPGLADLCRITIPQMEEALECFKTPDPYSRTKDNEGRRLTDIDGGWYVLNHPKYRKMASKEDEKEKAAIRQAEKRARDSNASSRNVTECNGGVTPERDNAEAEAEADTECAPAPVDLAEEINAVGKLFGRERHEWASHEYAMLKRAVKNGQITVPTLRTVAKYFSRLKRNGRENFIPKMVNFLNDPMGTIDKARAEVGIDKPKAIPGATSAHEPPPEPRAFPKGAALTDAVRKSLQQKPASSNES